VIKVNSQNNLEALFKPKSIAVIGASRHPGKIGYTLLKNIIEYGYKGKIYPINPKADEIMGLKAYKSILDVPDEVYMAIREKSTPSILKPMKSWG